MFRFQLYTWMVAVSALSYSCNQDHPTPGQLTVTTFAGNGEGIVKDGPALSASFFSPRYIIIDNLDNIYISEFSLIRKIYSNGEVTTMQEFRAPVYNTQVWFNGLSLESNNNLLSAFETMIGDGPYGLARFKVGGSENLFYTSTHSMLTSVAADQQGNIYLGTQTAGIKKWDATSNNLVAFAGGAYGYLDGTGSDAKFSAILDLVADDDGTIYATDYGNHCIRKVTANGTVTTLAGTNEAGFKDGEGTTARFFNPRGIGLDSKGNIYVCDVGNHSIRKITPGGIVTTIAGNGKPGYVDGPATTSQFNTPIDIDINSLGHMYVTDYGNKLIRMIK